MVCVVFSEPGTVVSPVFVLVTVAGPAVVVVVVLALVRLLVLAVVWDVVSVSLVRYSPFFFWEEEAS